MKSSFSCIHQSNAITLITALLLLHFPSYSQVTEEWIKRFNTSTKIGDGGAAIAVDDSGNVFVTGYIESSGVNGSSDLLTIKYSTEGVEQWATQSTGSMYGIDVAEGIVVDKSGNVYVTGWTDSGWNIFHTYRDQGKCLYEKIY